MEAAAGAMGVRGTGVKAVVIEIGIIGKERGRGRENEIGKGIVTVMSFVIAMCLGIVIVNARQESAIQIVIGRGDSSGNGTGRGSEWSGWSASVLSRGGGASEAGVRQIGRIAGRESREVVGIEIEM